MNEFVIREATPADAAGLVALARAVGSEPEGWLISTTEYRLGSNEQSQGRANRLCTARDFAG